MAQNQQMATILLLNGPNLNLLGSREPAHYGSSTLTQIVEKLTQQAEQAGVQLLHCQSNHEGVLIDRIHAAWQAGVQFIIINPAAFTHTSIALRDAFAAVNIPFIEVHLSNVHAREAFRHHSFCAPLAQGVICGLGTQGYDYALQHALLFIQKLEAATVAH